MKRTLIAFLLSLVATVGIVAQGRDTTTYVRLKSCVETKDSPGRGHPVEKPLPIYPVEFARAGIEGTAVVRIAVGKDGRATEISVVEASMKEFGEAAAKAAKGWKFIEDLDAKKKTPAGLIVDCRFTFTIADE